MPSEVAHILPPQPWMTAEETRAVVAALGAGGAEVRFVGGCVRDAVLGRPVRDIDIATSEAPETVIERLGAAGVRVVPTGLKHGTVTAIVNHRPFEITTLREDVETYGRHAKVAFTDDWDADAARRDFTMNAMSCTPEGELHDPFGGYEDARAGRVRFVGDPRARLEEDVLRLLRFYRFSAHYGNPPLDAEGRKACRAMAAKIGGLSMERVRDETLRLLEAPDPATFLQFMAEDGVLAEYLPEAADFMRLSRLVAIETAHAAPEAVRRLAALLPDPDTGDAVARRLKLSNEERKRIVTGLAYAAEFSPQSEARDWRAAIYRRGATAVRDGVLLYAAGLEQPFDVTPVLDIVRNWAPPRLPVGGRDAQALGLADGPAIGEVLRRVEDWWVDGDFQAGRDAALARLQAEAEKL